MAIAHRRYETCQALAHTCGILAVRFFWSMSGGLRQVLSLRRRIANLNLEISKAGRRRSGVPTAKAVLLYSGRLKRLCEKHLEFEGIGSV